MLWKDILSFLLPIGIFSRWFVGCLVPQEAQEAIIHDIQTALDSISKRVTAIEETQQRDWHTQVQQHDKITKIKAQMLQQQQVMQQYERTHSAYRQVSRI